MAEIQRVTWPQALGWRLARQRLSPVGDGDVADAVRSALAVPAWSGDPEVAVGMRRRGHEPGDVARALVEGSLVKTYAFGGAKLFAPEDVGAYLAVRSAGRQWARQSWVEHYALAPEDWPDLRAAVRDALADGPLPAREAVAAAAARHPRFRQAADRVSDSLVKALCWHGDVSLGPGGDGDLTLQLLATNPRWTGVPDLDDAGRAAVLAYLGAYGPATETHLHHWLTEGLSAGRRRVTGWLADVADRLAPVRVGDVDALLPVEHLDDLLAAEPVDDVHLLAAMDPWIKGPGTKDEAVVPAHRRALLSGNGAPVLRGGVVSGTWRARGAVVEVTWFGEAGAAPEEEIAAQVTRLGRIRGRSYDFAVTTA